MFSSATASSDTASPRRREWIVPGSLLVRFRVSSSEFRVQQPCALHGREKIFFHAGKIARHDGRSAHEHEIEWLAQFMLMKAERFAQQPLDPAADYGVAHFAADHDAEAGAISRGQSEPVGDEAAVHGALPGLLEPREIASVFQ